MFRALRGVDAVLAGVEPYDDGMLSSLSRLRCISRCGVGTDSIDLEAARRKNVTVLITAEEVVEPVAQMTVAMILALARNISVHCADLQRGVWRKCTGYLLSEWTVGLVGFGRIGRAVEHYLRVFNPRVLVADPNVQGSELPPGVNLCDLSALLSESDVVSLHAARRREEGPLMGRNEIGSMKYGARLVNTARGYLVDEAALFEALISGRLAGAALDVYGQEPYAGPLASLPQVLCAPHVATLTRVSRAAMELRCAQNVVTFFDLLNEPARMISGDMSGTGGTLWGPGGKVGGNK
jgi:D-3-phosphoglycerate dehydrogenase